MNLKHFFTKNWMHLLAVLLMFIITTAYFSMQMSGYDLKQHDIEQFNGASHEIQDYREKTGEQPLWTNSMFGGMPASQISVTYDGNFIKKGIDGFLTTFPAPAGIVFLYMFGFYILMLCLRVNPWVGLLGAIAFGFSSYDIIIIQAGHNSKALAVAFMAPVVGAFLLAYQRSLKWGIILSALFMALELTVNHLQITYYLAFLLLALGAVMLVEAIRKKAYKHFLLATAGLIGAYLIAGAVNYGNIALTNDYAKNTIRGANDLQLQANGTQDKQKGEAGLDAEYITHWSYGIGESFTLVSPYVKGGGSAALGNSPFAEQVENMDLTTEEMNAAMNSNIYWADQPGTSGPVYIGAIVVFLALLGMVFLKNPVKWALLVVAILALALSWGKNFMGLTQFFIDHVPGYNKFRAVTILLVLVELCIPIIGVLFLDLLIKEREQLKTRKKTFLITSGAMLVFLIGLKVVGLGDGYMSQPERDQLANYETGIREQLATMDPAQLLTQYQLDINNKTQVDEFVKMQYDKTAESFDAIKKVRASIYGSSMTRSILFVLFAAGLIALIFYSTVKAEFVIIGLVVLVSLDLIPVAWNYLGSQEEGTGYKFWAEKGNSEFPISASTADLSILDNEVAQNPALKAKLEKAGRAGALKADDLGYTGSEKRRVEDAYRFSALNAATNYRVYDVNGNFNSATASYLHKSLGGYHGAKLRNIQNLFEHHISVSNNKVFDMLNVKYFIQQGEQGPEARPNPTALGNAWFVRNVETQNTADEEIRALGTRFELTNDGQGTLVVNGEAKKSAVIYGREKLQYVLQNDSIRVPLANSMAEGMEALFVMDANGKTNLIPKQTMQLDTAKSFLRLVAMKVTHEFKPQEQAVMLKSEAQKLSGLKFSGEGTIRMTSYAPDKLVYAADVKDKQLAVFSEVYYPEGWTAKVDGQEVPILKVDYLLRGIELKPGKHKIEFAFDIPKYHLSNTFAYIGSILILLLIAGGIYLGIRKKKNNDTAAVQ
jgi:hypothetical protein